jgi:hypothetical protein
MTLADKASAEVPARMAWIVPFGTGPKSDCVRSITGNGYAVALMRDGSAIAVFTKFGYIYGKSENADDSLIELWAKVGRLMNDLNNDTRVRQLRESGTLIALSWYGCEYWRIGATVWTIEKTGDCDYHGLWSQWKLPHSAVDPSPEPLHADRERFDFADQ